MKGLKMNNLVKVYDNKDYGLITTSRIVAEGLGKQHKNVLRDLDKILENGDFRSLIIPTTYKVKGQNREYKEYLLTKDGFTLYMFNIQGYNDFKMAYINEFNRMEKLLSGEQLEIEPYKIKNKSYQGVPCMTIKDLAFLCGYDRSSVGAYIRENSLGELLTYNKLKDFKRENTDYEDVMCSLYVLYREDVFNIVDNFRKLKECKEFLDEYFKDKYFEPISDMKILKKLMNLKMIRQITNNFSLNEQMRMEFDYIISKEYVKLGFLDKPVNDLNINHREGWNLFCNIENWKNGLERK
ncbi:Rha family transcriptional regulator [Anaerococcus sp. AGMB00486]|uniref:Rha family transcriptional regulator n=2 Tax=Anaerococcus faecalis TaxID=2742993 RepID=A0ABX2NB07_9FIRM|nr:Rha family transcriptional regulator [Anaerococcus faecalis]